MMPINRSGRGGALLLFAWFFFAPFAPAHGEEWEASDYAWFVAGGAAGFVVHEGAHMLVAESFGLHPHVGTRSNPVPFVVIRYDLVGRKGPSGTEYFDRDGRPIAAGAQKKFATASAGINSQNLSSELILTRYPNLREERRPFLKGVLAFDIVTSIGYAVVGRRDPDGDLRGMAESRGVSNLFMAALVFAPAAIDLYRYYHPESVWAPWASRGAKAYLLGLSFRW
jgi:hypothetical protein